MIRSFGTVEVIGLGYIGLPTAAVLAKHGVNVVGVDIDRATVEAINSGRGLIIEPGLDDLIKSAVDSGRLRATEQPEPADAFVIAVPTPFADGHVPDLSYVEAAAASIAPHLAQGNLVILESTCPVGTTEKLADWLAAARSDLSFPTGRGSTTPDVNVAYCPERVLPGRILPELEQNDRVLGGLTADCLARAIEFYEMFVRGALMGSDARTAEMCKLTENAFRDVNIAFANELSLICDSLDINVWELIRLANCHPRVSILQPGPGVGGHCIAVDPWFIVDSAPELSPLILAARGVNDGKPQWVVNRVKAAARDLDHPCIACLGLAFKPDIDDLRGSPAVEVVRRLAAEEVGSLLVVEPFTECLPTELANFPHVEKVDLTEAMSRAEIVLLLVNHRDFYQITPRELEGKQVVDTRGVWG